MVSDTGGAWIQPVTLCRLSVGPDDQGYWWSMDTYCDSVYTSVYRNSLGSECGSRWSVILVGPGYSL